MSCQRHLQNIYLYEELSPKEKEKFDHHIQTCISCRELLQQVQQQAIFVRSAASARPEPVDPEQLTHNIMARLEPSTTQPTFTTRLLHWLDIAFIRYTLAGTSLALLLFFITEQLPPGTTSPASIAASPASATTVLNTSTFLQTYAAKKEDKQIPVTSWYRCLQDSTCTQTFIKEFKDKNISSL